MRRLRATAKSLTLRSSGQSTASRGLPLNANVRRFMSSGVKCKFPRFGHGSSRPEKAATGSKPFASAQPAATMFAMGTKATNSFAPPSQRSRPLALAGSAAGLQCCMLTSLRVANHGAWLLAFWLTKSLRANSFRLRPVLAWCVSKISFCACRFARSEKHLCVPAQILNSCLQTPNPAFKRTHHGRPRLGPISFWPKRVLPRCAA